MFTAARGKSSFGGFEKNMEELLIESLTDTDSVRGRGVSKRLLKRFYRRKRKNLDQGNLNWKYSSRAT
jgi:hypothetical protein